MTQPTEIYKVACINPCSNENVLLMVWAESKVKAHGKAEHSQYLSENAGWFIVCDKASEMDQEIIKQPVELEIDDDGDEFEWVKDIVKIDNDYQGMVFSG